MDNKNKGFNPETTTKIAVIGLGYVGLPLARLFSTKFPTVGFDMNPHRVAALNGGHDATLEVEDHLLREAMEQHGFRCTCDLEEIRDCNFYVVAVPTPVDADNVKKAYGIELVKEVPEEKYDAVVLCVAHDAFSALDLKALVKEPGVIYDVKSILPREMVDGRL